MSVQPFGTPNFRAYDSNGDPLSGGLLYTYAGGTSTPQATYTDSTGAVANANPVVLDSTGTAQVWMTAGVLYKFVLKDSSGVQQWSVDNYPSPAATATGSTSVAANDPGGRLSYSTTSSVPTSDLTSQATVNYLPHTHDQVPLYNGSSWSLYSIGTGRAQALSDTTRSPAAAVANSNYDLFLWLKTDGTVGLSRGPAWTSDTARGTGAGTTQLTTVNGRYVNAQNITNGPSANLGLYVGTIRTDGSALGTDSAAKRHLWNMYNRKPRPMRVTEATVSWTYNGAFRQANGAAGNQLDYVVGLSEDQIAAEVRATSASSTAGGSLAVGIGVDSTSTDSGIGGSGALTAVANDYLQIGSTYRGYPGLGRHYLAWLEFAGAGTTTWVGGSKCGISGEVFG